MYPLYRAFVGVAAVDAFGLTGTMRLEHGLPMWLLVFTQTSTKAAMRASAQPCKALVAYVPPADSGASALGADVDADDDVALASSHLLKMSPSFSPESLRMSAELSLIVTTCVSPSTKNVEMRELTERYVAMIATSCCSVHNRQRVSCVSAMVAACRSCR